MLYAGGDCTLSAQCQDDKFLCTDFQGGPPTTFGEMSYIVATDTDGEITFFEGFVPVGSSYLMDNNFERFPADQIIRVYSSDVTTEENLLQDVQYHSSCSQNLDLLNRFGSQGKCAQLLSSLLSGSLLSPKYIILTLSIFSHYSHC